VDSRHEASAFGRRCGRQDQARSRRARNFGSAVVPRGGRRALLRWQRRSSALGRGSHAPRSQRGRRSDLFADLAPRSLDQNPWDMIRRTIATSTIAVTATTIETSRLSVPSAIPVTLSALYLPARPIPPTAIAPSAKSPDSGSQIHQVLVASHRALTRE